MVRQTDRVGLSQEQMTWISHIVWPTQCVQRGRPLVELFTVSLERDDGGVNKNMEKCEYVE